MWLDNSDVNKQTRHNVGTPATGLRSWRSAVRTFMFSWHSWQFDFSTEWSDARARGYGHVVDFRRVFFRRFSDFVIVYRTYTLQELFVCFLCEKSAKRLQIPSQKQQSQHSQWLFGGEGLFSCSSRYQGLKLKVFMDAFSISSLF